MYYRRYNFTMLEKHSAHIDDRVYADKKLPQEKREFPNSQRSEYIRKLISKDILNHPAFKLNIHQND